MRFTFILPSNPGGDRKVLAAGLFSVIIAVLNQEREIPVLLESIFDQSYRPIEVVVIDGGSRDRSVELIAQFAAKHNGEDFTVTLVEEHGNAPRGVAFARNLGIDTAHGANVLLIDADYVLSDVDVDVITQLALALETDPTAHAKVSAQADSWLASNVMNDVRARQFDRRWRGKLRWTINGSVFRAEILRQLRFDASLGWGEDRDLQIRMAQAGLSEPILVDASVSKHYHQTLTGLRRQRQWYGRTAVLWLKKYHSVRDFFWALVPAAPFALIISLFIFFPFNILAAAVLFGLIFITFMALFLNSPTRNVGRIVYLISIRLLYSSFFYGLGIMQAIGQFVIRGQIDPSRGK